LHEVLNERPFSKGQKTSEKKNIFDRFSVKVIPTTFGNPVSKTINTVCDLKI